MPVWLTARRNKRIPYSTINCKGRVILSRGSTLLEPAMIAGTTSFMTVTESPGCFSAAQRWSSEGSEIRGLQPDMASLSGIPFPSYSSLQRFNYFFNIISLNLILSTKRLALRPTFRSTFYTSCRNRTDTGRCGQSFSPCG